MLRVAAVVAVCGPIVIGLALLLVIARNSENLQQAWLLVLTLPTIGTGIIAFQVDRVGVGYFVLILPLLFAFSGFIAVFSMFGYGFLILMLPFLALFACVAVGLRINWDVV